MKKMNRMKIKTRMLIKSKIKKIIKKVEKAKVVKIMKIKIKVYKLNI
jgi:hypothetical protein